MIEYNLAQYLQTELPALNFVVNGFKPNTADDAIKIDNTGGTPQHWYDRTDHTIQLLTRNNDVVIGKEQAQSVYSLLKNRFGLLLPSVTVSGVLYNALQTYQISPIQEPSYIGADDRGLHLFSFNIVVTTV